MSDDLDQFSIFTAAQPDEPVFSVSEFNELIYRHLQLLGDVVVEGEISEIKVSQNKWLSLTIKDESASLPIFGMIFKISGWRALEEGMRVRIYGSPRLYQKTGRFSLWANDIIPAGEGALSIAFQKLKAQLEKEGLFDIARKRTITAFPERIGLITAKNSQAYNDFVKILKQRMGGIKIFFYPVQVQGIDSARSVCSAFEYFNSHDHNLDAIVLTRGGGSLEDLQSFNDENVVRAIFSARTPVVCGVGHEGDITLSDLVADIRASTPSNAAELLVREKRFVLSDVNYMTQSILKTFNEELLGKKSRMFHVLNVLSGITHTHRALLHRVMQDFLHSVSFFSHRVRMRDEFVDESLHKAVNGVHRIYEKEREHFNTTVRLLNSLDYTNVLKRGYSITKTKNGSILRSTSSISAGEVISTQLAHGTIESTITNYD